MLSATVLIVGSGPVGLWLALELRRAGLDVLVIDSKLSRDARDRHSKALAMSAGSLATFDSRGMAGLFLRQGMPLAKAHFGGLETLLELNDRVLGVRYSHNLAIPQAHTELILLGQCEEVGVRFVWGCRFCRLTQTSQRVIATVERVVADSEGDGHASRGGGDGDDMLDIEATWLVGCDGTHSSVRDAAGIAFEGMPSTVTGILADVQLTQVPADGSSSYAIRRGPQGTSMILPIGDGIHHRFVGIFKDSLHVKVSETVTIEDVRCQIRDTFGSDLGVHSPLWLSRFGSACRLASSFRAGRVFLAGDAAHQFFPAGGQGMNLGLQDATNLAWKLVMASSAAAAVRDGHAAAAAAVTDRILDSYSRERRPIAAELIENVWSQIGCFLADKRHENALRSVMVEALTVPELNALWARRLTGFGEPRSAYSMKHRRLGEATLDDDGDKKKEEEEEEDQLVGTRLTHLRIGPDGDELLRAITLDRFVLLLRENGNDEKDHAQLREGVQRWVDRVTVLSPPSTISSDARWDGVVAVLVRPDLRIAWAGRTEASAERRVASLVATLTSWFGNGV